MSAAQQPVLLLSFNRPDRTREVLNVLAGYEPPRLYFAVDGPRPGRPDEAARVHEVQGLVEGLPWACEVHTLFREANLGCRLAVSGAVGWFMSHEEEGIVLEDDALPEPTFFPFAEQLLNRFRNDTRVIAICGEAFAPPSVQDPRYSYRFSQMAACKAWALWRDSWEGYTPDLRDWRSDLSWWNLFQSVRRKPLVATYWATMFDLVADGKVDSWAYGLMYLGLRRRLLTAVPNGNLVTDTGVGGGATHTKTRPDYFLPSAPVAFPLRHPAQVALDTRAERWTHRNELGLSPRRLMRGIRKRLALRRGTASQ